MSLSSNLSSGNIIRLFTNPNVIDGNWRYNGKFGVDSYAYFIIPDNYSHAGGNNFELNFPFTFVNRALRVSDGHYTEPVWILEHKGNTVVTLQTDKTLKLPYIESPTLGILSKQKLFFIPTNEEY